NGDCVWSWRYQYWNNVSEQYDMNTVVHLTSGIYYFCVERSDGTGNYNFNLGFTGANESFKETTGGINNTLATASKISLNTKYNGQIADNDSKDFYMFTLPSSGNIKLSINANIYKTNYYIYDSKGTVVWELRYQYWNDTSKKYTNTQTITLSNGTYYFCIEKSDGCGNYNFTISLNVSVGKVSSLKASQSTSAISLSWSKVSGATGYQVYKYDSAKKKYVKLTSVSTNSYKATKLNSGTTYKYAVRAYKKVGSSYYYGSFSYITAATKPGTPTLAAKAGTKKVSLSWNKQTGATGYVVYMATSKNGTYKKIATVKGSTNVSYIRTGLTKGKTYYFKVRAYKTVNSKNIYGSYSAIKSAKVK
ncbi:MAG: fibronectin type III domain-containing protein, partial [Acutalibacteraceae bacterium]